MPFPASVLTLKPRNAPLLPLFEWRNRIYGKALDDSFFLRVKRSLQPFARNVVFWPMIGQRKLRRAFRSLPLDPNNIAILPGASGSRQTGKSEQEMSVEILRSVLIFVLLFTMSPQTYHALVSFSGARQEMQCLLPFSVKCLRSSGSWSNGLVS